ncbi:MAG: hypothetical protein KAR19_13195 [Bacteroidales bacterium]|nr:hypothetical protein [Bacteroidales bacterium]
MINSFEKFCLTALFLSIITVLPGQHVLTPAPEHFEKFNHVENGWCASDATISLLLPDGNNLWLWGDCIIGEKESTFDVKNETATMINNAAIIEEDGVLTAYYQGSMADPSSLIPGEGDEFFWPEHATIENDTLKIFAIRIIYEDTGIPGFNFRVGTTHMASFTYPEMQHIRTEEIGYITDSTMRFGTYVLEKDGYKYIFGKKDTVVDGYKYPVPMLARVENSVDEPWQFFAGDNQWSYNCSEAKPIGDRPMSESYFVYEKNNKFYLIMHEIWLIGELYILESDQLTGPWNRASTGGIENKFAVIRPHGKNFTYNLFAHPHFRQGEDILISYNVNNSDFWPIFDDTRNYRARFHWLNVESAVSTSIPDTLDYYDSVVGINDQGWNQGGPLPSISIQSGLLHIKGVTEKSRIEICGIDGRKFLSRQLAGEEVISLEEIPAYMLVIRLTGPGGTQVQKVLNIN